MELQNEKIVESMKSCIEQNLKNNHWFVELENQFSKQCPTYPLIFKEQVGLTVIEYVNKVRINEAEKLLEKTTLDIKEVAKSVGINGYFEFTQLFKRMIGVTPSGYRNQLLKTL
jgi:YesN/AraC family two-component response regulator